MSNRRATPAVVLTGRNAGKPAEKAPVPKILVCAPSNAAIDEVTKRLKEGVWNSVGKRVTPQVVRVGADASVNIVVKDISLDALVEQRLAAQPEGQRQEKSERHSVLQEIQDLKRQKQVKQEQTSAAAGNSARVLQLEQEIKEINAKRMKLSARANELREQDTNAQRALDTVRRKARVDILNEADVICCTLSGSGHEALDGYQFDLIVIDESAQAIELSSLIPLKFQAKRCVMVGGTCIDTCHHPCLLSL
jgi:senataxin